MLDYHVILKEIIVAAIFVAMAVATWKGSRHKPVQSGPKYPHAINSVHTTVTDMQKKRSA